jgi:hypothetical protein
MRGTESVLNAVSAEARRYYRARYKSKWLTNVLRADGDRKVFRLEGTELRTRRRFATRLEFPLGVSLCEFLTAVMNCPDGPMALRLDAAKNIEPLMHWLSTHVLLKTCAAAKRGIKRRKRASSVVAGGLADEGVDGG